MKNIKFTLSRIDHIPDYISSEALDYWFTNDNFIQLIKIIYKNIDFFVGDYFDLTQLNTIHVSDICGNFIFTRDISEDFENVLQIKRKTYSSISYIKGGHTSEVTFEVYFPNY